MKAIILSAGQGSRLGHLVDDRPKCLIDFNGRTLLDRQLDALEANGVHEAVVVTGFHDELVNQAIAKRIGGPSVRTIFNPFFKVADNTGSLFMAREELAGDCLVWNGDTLVSRELMRRVVGNKQSGICVTIDRKHSYDEDDQHDDYDDQQRDVIVLTPPFTGALAFKEAAGTCRQPLFLRLEFSDARPDPRRRTIGPRRLP
jgi:choline kinase